MRRLVAFALGAVVVAGCSGVALAWLSDARLFDVRTGSMAPTIGRGALAVVSPVAAQRIKEGDVIAFRTRDRQPVLHRVVAIVFREDGPAFVTQGDANREPDGIAIPGRDVLGRMTFSLPKVGHVTRALGPPWGVVVLGGGPLVLHVASLLWRRRAAHDSELAIMAV